ncbi:hypothetical protein AB0C34_09915 [Nocardia sp. NPDC049220]|uniref:hypothetical protein n=1 Tax=Nocardia sp. NPDC049220 TaxID=3155273 RepID=UPI0033D3D545
MPDDVPLLSQVWTWQPWKMTEAGREIKARNADFGGLAQRMVAQIRDAGSHWDSAAYWAAYDRVAADSDTARKVAHAVDELGDAMINGGKTLTDFRDVLVGKVAEATEAGLTVADDGSVGTPAGVFGDDREAARRIHQEAIDTALREMLSAQTDITIGIAHASDQVRARGEQFGGGDSGHDPSVVALSWGPAIPGMPPLPPRDSGQGPHGSQPWYSRGDDIALEAVVQAAVVAADAQGLSHASNHLRHYLGNSGADVNLDPDQIMRNDPGLKQIADDLVSTEVQRICTETTATGNYGIPIPFQSPWRDYSFDPEQQRDWFLALGAVENSASGVVIVHSPEESGGQPRITVDYRTHIFDRYNWDRGKVTEIAGFDVFDSAIGALHTAGLAQEFDLLGSSAAKHYEGALPADGQLTLPNGPDSHSDARTVPEGDNAAATDGGPTMYTVAP